MTENETDGASKDKEKDGGDTQVKNDDEVDPNKQDIGDDTGKDDGSVITPTDGKIDKDEDTKKPDESKKDPKTD